MLTCVLNILLLLILLLLPLYLLDKKNREKQKTKSAEFLNCTICQSINQSFNSYSSCFKIKPKKIYIMIISSHYKIIRTKHAQRCGGQAWFWPPVTMLPLWWIPFAFNVHDCTATLNHTKETNTRPSPAHRRYTYPAIKASTPIALCIAYLNRAYHTNASPLECELDW